MSLDDRSLSGRRAQAAANDEVILRAARDVLIVDPTAPIAAVAERAGVGISAIYRRYPSKEALVGTLGLSGSVTLHGRAGNTATQGLINRAHVAVLAVFLIFFREPRKAPAADVM